MRISSVVIGAFLLVLICPDFAKADPAVASWYGPGFEHHRMACGGIFRSADETIVASKTLDCGTRLRLTNPETGRVAEGVVQDRGPYVRGRSLDLSRALAKKLGYERKGVAALEIDYITPNPPPEPEAIPAAPYNSEIPDGPIS